MACTADEDYLDTKTAWAFAASCIGLLICIIFAISIEYIQNIMAINAKLLDFDLVSIEDYTVRGKIDKSLYESVVNKEPEADELAQIEDEKRDLVAMRRFKRFLIDQI